jgi:hypothetical protein
MIARGWGIVVAVGLLAVAGVSPARAQGDGLDGMIADPLLLLNKGVQKELKLSEDQIKQATAIALGVQEAQKTGAETLRREIADEAEQSRQIMEMARGLHSAAAAKLKDVLSVKQADRLKQVHLWRLGIFAFQAPPVQSALKLTDAQKEELRAAFREALGQRPSLRAFRAANPDATLEGWYKAVKAVDDRAMARMVKVLDPRQRAQWSEMLGPPFEYKQDGPNQPAP